MALQRFTLRRGNPRSMWSNNGQNFIEANRELKFLLKNLDQTAIANSLSLRNIQWHFIPPSSSWMGGALKSLVKITKKALKSVTNNRPIREDQLITTLVQIERTITSRRNYQQFINYIILSIYSIHITILSPHTDSNKQILQGQSLNIKIYPLKVSNIQRGATELNIISTRVDKSYIQQEWACYICFIIYVLTFF